MNYIAFDLLIFWVAVIVGAFGWRIGAPVLVLIGVIFVVTSVIWMAMDLFAYVKEE